MIHSNTPSPKTDVSDLLHSVPKPTVPNSTFDDAVNSIKSNSSSSSPQVRRRSTMIKKAPTRFKY